MNTDTNNKISISIVLPCYNEEANIHNTVEKIYYFCLFSNVVSDFEIIVVNDGSKDRSIEILHQLQTRYPKVLKIVNHDKNLGYGKSLTDGFKNTTCDWIFFTDSDGQFDINDLDKFLIQTNNADFIIGRRINRKDRMIRKLNAKFFNFFVKIFFGIKVKDIDCAFKLFRREVFDISEMKTDSAMVNAELVYRAKKNKAKFLEIDVNHYERQYGTATGGDIRVIGKAMKEFVRLRYHFFKKETDFVHLNSNLVGLLALIIVSIAIKWAYTSGVILAYGDAEAHLNISKRAVDSLTPGLSQLGGVWLPLPHLSMLPFVWNEFLWRSGLAGSLVSAIAYIWASAILYRFGYLVTKNYIASFVAPLVFMLNPNALYLATTPMSEILLFSTIISSLYFFVQWVYKENLFSLIFAAFFVFLASLSRYDGWFLLIAEICAIVFISMLKRKSFKWIEGKVIVFSVLGFLGIIMWLAWNQLIFGNMLYFANSDYGSKAQQMWFFARGYLPTYHNLPLSVLYYLVDTYLVVGIFVCATAILGILLYLFTNFGSWVRLKNVNNLSLLLLFSPLVFYSVSLFTGQASLILPTFAQSWYEWNMSNVRYGMQMLIPASIFCAYLASKIKFSTVFIVVLIILQFSLLLHNGVIAYQDGVRGLSSQNISKGPDAPPVEEWINHNYESGLVLMDDYRRPISPVNSGIPMQNFISVGNKPYWQESLDNPTTHAEWIIIQKAETDAVWRGLKNKQILDDYYLNLYRSGNIWVYKKRQLSDKFVSRQSQNFMVHGEKFVIKGTNVYDLLQFSYSDIDKTLTGLKNNNINVIRMWGFNKEGRLKEEDYSKFDYILQESSQKGIYILVVFGNQWDDYAGLNKFTQYENQDFYTDNNSIDQFKSHIEDVITHKNILTGIEYKNDSTILGWEMLNEPRMESDKDSLIISTWVEKIGQFIATIDNNHLISIGIEGFIGGNNNLPYHENHGSNLQSICKLTVIDMCSVHLYPKYFTDEVTREGLETLFTEWQRVSDEFHKPLYIGEVGFDLESVEQKTKYEQREKFFNDVFTIAKRKKINGIILWNISLNHDNYFSLSLTNKEDQEIFRNWNLID